MTQTEFKKPPGQAVLITTIIMDKSTDSTADFLVHWSNKNNEMVAPIQCRTPTKNCRSVALDEPQVPLSVINTPKVTVAVANMHWTLPTTINLTHNRAGLCLLQSKSQNMSITYGYDEYAKLQAKVGHVLMLLPGKNLYSHSSEGKFRSVMCSFEPGYADSILSKTLGSIEDISDAQWNSALDVRNSLASSLLLRLMHEVLQPSKISESIVEAYGHALLLESAHWLSSRSTGTEVEGRLSAQHFTLIDEYLAESSGRIPRVAEIAQACGLSERYFAKLFREQTRITVGQYIQSAQIAKAKRLLLETDLTLKEISYQLGFSSQSNFSSAFKSVAGVAPGTFRQQS